MSRTAALPLARRAIATLVATALAATVTGGVPFAAPAAAQEAPEATRPFDVERVSVGRDGEPTGIHQQYGGFSDLSADGRYAVFTSMADDLVPGQEPDGSTYWSQVFRRDLATGVTELVSVTADGAPATERSRHASISGDGRYVAFTASDPSLTTPAQDNGYYARVLVRDMELGRTFLVGAADTSAFFPRISDDGSTVAYLVRSSESEPDGALVVAQAGDADGTPDDRVWEQDGPATLVERAAVPGTSETYWWNHSVSGDGNVLAWYERIGTREDSSWYLKVHDRRTGTTRDLGAVVVPRNMWNPADNLWPPALSADGSTVGYVVIELERDVVMVRDLAADAPEEVVASSFEDRIDQVAISADGRHVVYSLTPPNTYAAREGGWHAGSTDTYALPLRLSSICYGRPYDGDHSELHRIDRVTGATVHVNATAAGGTAEQTCSPAVSADGTTVLFDSYDATLVAGTTEPGELDWDVFAATVPHAAAGLRWSDGAALRTGAVSATTVQLSWDAALPGEQPVAGYRVRRAGVQVGADLPADARSHLVTGLAPSTEHAFSVEAFDAAGTVTPRLTATATTVAQDSTPGATPLGLALRPGGVVELSWDAREGATAYRVLRSTGSGPVEVAAEVTGQSHVERGLDADTTYGYVVHAVVDGAAVPHTVRREAAIGPVAAASLTLTAPRVGLSRIAALGGTAELVLRGEPHRTATVDVTVTDWLDDAGDEREAPAQEVEQVALTEREPGTYTASLLLRDGLASVVSAVGQLADGAGHSSPAVAATGTPVEVSGAVALQVDAPADALPGARLLTWSTSRERGTTLPVSGGGAVRLLLPAAADHRVRLVRADGVEAGRVDTAVRAGLVTSTTLQPRLAADVVVHVLDADGEPATGEVEVRDPATGRYAAGRSTPSAPLRLRGFDGGSPVRVTARTAGLTAGTGTVEQVLVAGENAVEVATPRLPVGRVAGTVTASDGPLEGAEVRVTQTLAGRTGTATVRTGADGRYEVKALAGAAVVDVSDSSTRRAASTEVQVPEGGTVTVDRVLSTLRPYVVDVALHTRYLGSAPLRQPVDMRTGATLGLSLALPGSVSALSADRTPVLGLPGDEVRVCSARNAFGLEGSCATGVLPAVPADGSPGRLELALHLAEPAAVRLPLLDAAGAPFTDGWSGALVQVDDEGRRTLVRTLSGAGTARVSVPGPGAYLLDLTAGDRSWRSAVVHVADGELVELPPLRARATGPFSGPGNEVRALRPSVLPDGTAELRTAFAHDGSTPVADAVVRLEVPAGTTVLPESVLLDGRPVTGTAVPGGYEVALGTLAPGTRGVLRHSVRLDGVAAGSALHVDAVLRGSGTEAVLGAARVEVTGVTLLAPRRSASRSVAVSGRAPAGASVAVLSAGAVLARTSASAGGYYDAVVTLPDLGQLHRHLLHAEAAGEGTPLRSETEPVVLDADHVVAQEVTVQQEGGRRVAFDPAKGVARFPYVLAGSAPLVVEARFADPSKVEDVRVRVGSREVTATLVDGVHRASLQADGQAGITVDHTSVGTPVRLDSPPDGALSEDQVRGRLPVALRDFVLRGEPTSEQDGEVRRSSFALDLPTVGGSLTAEVELERGRTHTVTAAEAEQERRTGAPVYGLELTTEERDGGLLVTLSAEVPEDQLGGDDERAFGRVLSLLSRSFGHDDAPTARAALLPAGFVVGTARASFQTFFSVGTNVESAYQAITAGGKYEEIEGLYTNALHTGCDLEMQDLHRQMVDSVAKQAMRIDAANAVLTVAGMVLAPVTFGIGTLAVWGVGYALGKVLDAGMAASIKRVGAEIESSATFCKREGRVDLADLEPGRTAQPVWIYDPSGVVYEAVRSNRLAGVTATVLHKDERAGTWAAWDAAWFGQDNPQVTGADGHYAWDVPEGLWQVVYEKDGYEQARSAELRVLPPHLDVDVALVSYAAPRLDEVTAAAGGPVELVFDRHLRPSTVEVAVRRDGADVAGVLQPVDAEAAPDGPTYARRFRFVPAAALGAGDALTVTVGGGAQSYAGTPLGEDAVREVTVPQAPTPTPTPEPEPTGSPTGSPTASPTTSASASPPASPTTSPTASAPASPTAAPTTTAPASPPAAGDGTGGGGSIPVPIGSPSTSPSPTSSPTTSPTSSPTAAPTVPPACSDRPVVTLDRSTIAATGEVQATVTGVRRGATVQLWAYTRPSTTYRLVREQVVGDGPVTWRLRPPASTRLQATVAGCPAATASGPVVVEVRTVLTLAARRVGVRDYVFSGDSLPARAGGLVVSLYRVTADGRQVLAAQARAHAATGEWSLRRQFTGGGRFGFVARTGRDLQNAPGSSSTRPTLVF